MDTTGKILIVGIGAALIYFGFIKKAKALVAGTEKAPSGGGGGGSGGGGGFGGSLPGTSPIEIGYVPTVVVPIIPTGGTGAETRPPVSSTVPSTGAESKPPATATPPPTGAGAVGMGSPKPVIKTPTVPIGTLPIATGADGSVSWGWAGADGWMS